MTDASQASAAWWRDVAVGAALATLMAWGVVLNAEQAMPHLVGVEDVWFESDTSRVFQNMSSQDSNHYRAKVHPLFPLVTYGPVAWLGSVFQLQPEAAVQTFLALVACAWMAAVFTVLRLMGCRRFDAVVFSLLAAGSASATFWFAVPETYSLGSLTILIALGFMLVAQRRAVASVWYVLVSAMTFSMTVTNWMVGLILTFVQFPWRRALKLSAAALGLVVSLWLIQKPIFPSTEFFIGSREELRYLLDAESGGPARIIKAIVFHSMVMPAIHTIEREPVRWYGAPRMRLSVQQAAPGSAGPFGVVAAWLWMALLSLGVWGAWTSRAHRPFCLVLGLTLAGQLALHLLYGPETFLYSLHVAPLLVLLAACSVWSRARAFAVVLAGGLLLCLGVNNPHQFTTALQRLQTIERVSPLPMIASHDLDA